VLLLLFLAIYALLQIVLRAFGLNRIALDY
jgi:hypothetical protein